MNLLYLIKTLVPKLFRWGLISRWLIALCAWAVSMQVVYPMLLPFSLPGFINVIVVAMCLCVLAIRLAERFSPGRPLWVLAWPFLHLGDMIAIIFIVCGVAVYLNGVLGEGQAQTTYGEIMSVERDRLTLGSLGPMGRVRVQVQGGASDAPYLWVNQDTISRLLPGEVVTMQMYQGGLGIPWVELNTVYYDFDATLTRLAEQEGADFLILRWRVTNDLGRNRHKQGLAKAKVYFNEQPDDLELARLVAGALHNSRRSDLAVQLLEPFINRIQNYDLYCSFASHLLENGDGARSLEYLNAAIALDSNKPQAYYQLGHTHKRLGHQKESREAFLQLVQRAPEYASLLTESALPPTSGLPQGRKSTVDLVRQGTALFVQKQFAQSIPFYQQAIDLEKTSSVLPQNDWRALVNYLSVAYGFAGNLPQAKATLDYGLSVDPLYAMFHYNLACVFAEMNVPADALRALETAYRNRQHVSPGETMPDPRSDPSFQRLLNQPSFKAALERLSATQS